MEEQLVCHIVVIVVFGHGLTVHRKVWPAVTAFSFTFIQPHYRSIFAGFIAIFWQTYLSWLNRAAELAEKDNSKSILAKGGEKAKKALQATRT